MTNFIQAKYNQVKANKKSDQIVENLRSTATLEDQQALEDKRVYDRLFNNIPLSSLNKKNKTNSVKD